MVCLGTRFATGVGFSNGFADEPEVKRERIKAQLARLRGLENRPMLLELGDDPMLSHGLMSLWA